MTDPDPAVLFHVGLHKTGTTWLQKQIFAPQSGTAFEYCEDRRLIRGPFVVQNPQFFDPEAVRRDLAPLLARARKAGLPLILSDEMLAGLPFHQRYTRVIAAQNIKAVFPNAKILVTIREQNSVIYSSYGHYIRAGFLATLDDYLAQPPEDKARLFTPILNLDHFDYLELLSFYERLFTPENVMIAPMEWMLAAQAAFVTKLSDFLGADIASPPQAVHQKINPAWSDLALKAARQVNRFTPQDARWRKKSAGRANAVAWWVNRLTPGSVQARAKARSLEKVRSSVADRYRLSNQALSARLDLDLGPFGYAV